MKDKWKIEQHRQRKLAAARLKKERLKRDYTERETDHDYWHYKQHHPGIVIHDLTGFVFSRLTVIAKLDPCLLYTSPADSQNQAEAAACGTIDRSSAAAESFRSA